MKQAIVTGGCDMNGKSRGIGWDELLVRLRDGGADAEVLDRFEEFSARRRFFGQVGKGGAALALLGLGAGSEAAMRGLFGRGLIPEAWAEEAEAEAKTVPDKPGMTVHSTRPVNGEYMPHELDDDITPIARHFVRNNGLVPERAGKQDPQGWKLTIDGEVHKTLELTLDDLRRMPAVTLPLLVECGGNGRALFDPPVRGNPWKRGAVGCAEWTGVPLRDLLREAGLKNSAIYTGHYGEDPALSGDQPPISRGIPLDKALEPNTLVAYKMNGEDLPALHGYPVRLVVPGWVGSCSQKWLTRIWIRDQVHDGPKMGGSSYRLPAYPVRPGQKVPDSDMVIATAWGIKSLITRPAENASFRLGEPVRVRGHAWAGENRVRRVLISTDFGVNWERAELQEPTSKYAWYSWETVIKFPGKGYYEIWARAFDDKGNAQPFVQPWNPRGYMSNVIHRVPIEIMA
jgi:DMSO/TMAO reductase YedYZ molybdopterin-dependent catalytic subunit